MPAPHPRMHGLTHVTGGPDPIPGLLPGVSGDYPTMVLSIPGLRGYWRLGEAASPFLDSSGYSDSQPADLTRHVNGVAMTLHTTGALPAGVDDGAVAFNYPDTVPTTNTAADWLEGDGPAAGTGRFNFADDPAMSAAAWIKPLASSNEWAGGILNASDIALGTPSYPAGWALYLTWPTLELVFFRGGSTVTDQTTVNAGVLPAGGWLHVAATYDGATARVYVNGGLAATAASTFDLREMNVPATVGHMVMSTTSGRGRFYGSIDEAAVWAAVLTPEQVAALAASAGEGFALEGWVLTLDEDGNPVWEPPSVPDVTVNGDDPDAAGTPLPSPDPRPADPNDTFPDDDDWIVDEPFTYGGSTFEVLPKKWTTIPFTSPLMERWSNVTGEGTTHTELDWDDPAAAGWINPDTPRAITIPHDVAFIGDAESWMQVCLRLENPLVEAETSYRALRIFETTHQKTLMQAESFRADCCDEHGAINVYRDLDAPGWTPFDSDIFASGDTGGFDNGNHDRVMFMPNSGFGWYLNGNDWLPLEDGQRMLKAGMRLVPQVWHDASVPLTFDCSGTAPYKPHFVVCQVVQRAWGSPWSDWPTF